MAIRTGISLLRNFFQCLFKSSVSLPVLFLLTQYKVWLGIQTLTADTGDGLAAFKFTQYLPRYWNWYESAGQPFLFDAGAYRLIDPLMWPLLFLVKQLPVSILVQYNAFLLIRIALILWGIDKLLSLFSLPLYERRVAQFLCCFGSFSAVMYRSIGMMDLMFAFVFLAWSSLEFLKTEKLGWLYLFTAVFLHSALSYHILYLMPVLLLFWGLTYYCLPSPKKVAEILRTHAFKLGACLFLVLSALGAEYLVTRDPLLMPALRNFRYQAEVNENGVVQSPGAFHGQNIFNRSKLSATSEECHKTVHCREFELRLLDGLFLFRSYYSLTAFLSIFALVVLGLLPFFIRGTNAKPIQGALIFSVCVFLWSLGSQTPFWGLTQKLFPFLVFVRHTGFFVPLFTLSGIVLFAFLLSRLTDFFRAEFRFSSKKLQWICFFIYALIIYFAFPRADRSQSKWLLILLLGFSFVGACLALSRIRVALFGCVILECLIFQRAVAEGYKDFVRPEQLEMIDQILPAQIVSRQLRVLNSFGIPRSGAATGYSMPSALEPVRRPGNPAESAEIRFHNLRHFGFFTPFLLRSYVEARMYFSAAPKLFDRVFGVAPFSVFSIYSLDSLCAAHLPKSEALEQMGQQKLLLDLDETGMAQWKGKSSTQHPPLYGDAVKIDGENLSINLTQMEPAFAYLAISYEAVERILVNGIQVPHYKANHFGVGFPLSAGTLEIEIQPQLKTKFLFCILFYGAYSGLAGLLCLDLSKQGRLLLQRVRRRIDAVEPKLLS